MLTLLPPAGFRTRAALKAEILALRHQLLVLQRSSRGQTLRSVGLTESSWSGSRSCGTLGGRPCSSSSGDRHRLASQGVSALLEVEESALRRPSNRRSGSSGPDSSIRRMSLANPHGGAPHTHGELLKLGIQVSQATLAQTRRPVRHSANRNCKSSSVRLSEKRSSPSTSSASWAFWRCSARIFSSMLPRINKR